jgi:hypothetical protein
MLNTDIPLKVVLPFASAAGPTYSRQIPVASQQSIQAGAASFTDGFPPDTFIPPPGGGTPPFGKDFNGLSNQVTAWSRWQAAGGPVYYDGTFATDPNVNGYPKGAMLAATGTPGRFWISTVDGNTTDPDAGGANWQLFPRTTISNLAAGHTVVASDHLLQFRATASINLALPLSTTLFNGFGFWVYATNGAVGLSIQPSDAIAGAPSGVGYIVQHGESVFVSTNAANNWLVREGDRSGVLNVLYYGADPTGTIDSVPAYVSACAAAGVIAENVEVLTPAGQYLLALQGTAKTNWLIPVKNNTYLNFSRNALMLSQNSPGGSYVYGGAGFVNADYSGGSGGNLNIHVRGGRWRAASQAAYPTGDFSSGNSVITNVNSEITKIRVGMGVFGPGSAGGGTGSLVVAFVTDVDLVHNRVTMSLPAVANHTTQQFFCGWGGGPFFDLANTQDSSLRDMTWLDVYGAGPLQAINVVVPHAIFSLKNSIVSDHVFGFELPAMPSATYYGAIGGFAIRGGNVNVCMSNWTGTIGDDFLSVLLDPYLDQPISGLTVTNINGSSIWGGFRPAYIDAACTAGTIQDCTFSNIVINANTGGGNPASCGMFLTNSSLVQQCAFTGSISGSTLTVTAVASGTINIGNIIKGSNVAGDTTIIARGTGTGGTGTYTVSNGQTVGSEAMTGSFPRGAVNSLYFNNVILECSTIGAFGATINNSTDLHFNGLKIYNQKAYGVYMTNVDTVDFDKLEIPTANRTAVDGVLAEANSNNITIKNSKITNQGGNAITLYGVQGGDVSHNQIFGNAANAISLVNSTFIQVLGNRIGDNGALAVIETGSSNFNNVVGNNVHLNTNGQITLSGAQSLQSSNLT